MVLPRGCEVWEYSGLPGCRQILGSATSDLLNRIGSLAIPQRYLECRDTRRAHQELFIRLVPTSSTYYAGHYRGEAFRCLQYYEVRVTGDPRVGHAAATVPMEMRDFSADVKRSIDEIEFIWSVHDQTVAKHLKVLATVRIIAALFVYFLEIHPYANGNGHIGRFLVVTLMSCYLGFPRRFPVEPRPPDPPYTQLISDYRTGNKLPLEKYLLDCI